MLVVPKRSLYDVLFCVMFLVVCVWCVSPRSSSSYTPFSLLHSAPYYCYSYHPHLPHYAHYTRYTHCTGTLFGEVALVTNSPYFNTTTAQGTHTNSVFYFARAALCSVRYSCLLCVSVCEVLHFHRYALFVAM